MVEGHMKGGKFHPHNNNSSSGITSDQVKDENQPEMNTDNLEKLKKRD